MNGDYIKKPEELPPISIFAQPAIASRPRPIIAVIKKIAIARGADPAKVDEAIAIAESEKPIRDWLVNGGWEDLIKFILFIIKGF